mgnify:CR=1 FL=1
MLRVIFGAVSIGIMPKTHRVDVDVKEFCGWDEIKRILHRAKEGEERALIAALFLTGGRISEVLRLVKENFDLSRPDVVLVKGMHVSKRFKKVGEYWAMVDGKKKKRWKTEKVAEDRTFPIMRYEPPVPILLNWLKGIPSGGKLFQMSRVQAFLTIRSLGPDLYPHWFRAQRASQLASEYDFDLHQLMDYFHWKDIHIAMHYSRLGWKGMAKQMVQKFGA